MEKLANTLWKRGESEEGEGWVECGEEERQAKEESGGEGRVEFSREGDVILKHSIQ